MGFDQHDRFRDRLTALPLSSGRRGIAAMVLVEIVRWVVDDSLECVLAGEELGDLLNLRQGDVLMALGVLESLGVIERGGPGRMGLIRLKSMPHGKQPGQLAAEITEAINCHIAWKRRLRLAVETGGTDVPVDEVAGDTACAFGQWLHGPDFAEADKNAEYELVRQLHAQFHRVAAATLQLALNGKKAEAERSLGVGGLYAHASSRLTKALVGWRKTVMP